MSNIYTYKKFYNEVSILSTNFDDFNQEEMQYEEMVAQEYSEVHSLGMKPVVAAICDVLLIPEFIDQFIEPLDPRVQINIGVLIKLGIKTIG